MSSLELLADSGVEGPTLCFIHVEQTTRSGPGENSSKLRQWNKEDAVPIAILSPDFRKRTVLFRY